MTDYRQALFDSRPPRMSLKPPVLHFPFPRTLALLSVYQCWPKWLPDERFMSWSVACGLEREREFSLRLLWGGMAEGQTTTGNSLEASYTLWRGESWDRARLSDFLRTQTVHNQVAECCLCLTPVCMTLKTGTFLYQIVSARPWPGNGHLLTFVTSSLSETSVNLLLSKRYQSKFQQCWNCCQHLVLCFSAFARSEKLGSLQLGHSYCFSSHYNGYLWLQHLVQLTVQSVSSLHCFSQSPLFSAWLWNKHLAPLYWPKYVVSLLVSLKTKCLFRPATDKNYVEKL